MRATRLKKSATIREGVYYELDTPIQHKGKKYRTICTWSSKQHQTGILIFPAMSGVTAVVKKNGKLVLGDNITYTMGYVKSEQLVKQLGYELA